MDFAIDCPDFPLARKIFILVAAERTRHPDICNGKNGLMRRADLQPQKAELA
jgi:hypothetical protein